MPSDLRILLLTREYPPDVYGGAGVHVDYLARELAKLIAVEVRTFGDQEIRAGNLVVQGFRSEQRGAPETPEKLVMALAALRVCVGFVSRPIDASAVHCHTWYSHLGGVLAKILYGIPLVVTAHSLEPLRPWKREQLGRGADLSAWAEKTALEMADAVVAVSQEMRADILRLFAVAPERLHVIYNGVDTEEYQRTPDREGLDRYGIDHRRPYVLFVGRMSRQKGILHLLRAAPYLEPETQLVLCASSPDDEDLAREVEAAVARVQASRRGVIWIREMVDRATAIQLYSHAAVFCCPSIYEPFGIINLEAMACETPVVASAVGGIKEVVVHGETGFLVPVEQQAAPPYEPIHPERFSRDLAEAVNALLGDAAQRRRMGIEGRRRAEGLFSWGAVAGKTIALYRGLVDGHGGSTGRA